jgi:hypothetical protein
MMMDDLNKIFRNGEIYWFWRQIHSDMASFGETFQCKKYIKGVGGIVSFKGLASEWHKLVNDVFSVFVLEAGGAKLRGSLSKRPGQRTKSNNTDSVPV